MKKSDLVIALFLLLLLVFSQADAAAEYLTVSMTHDTFANGRPAVRVKVGELLSDQYKSILLPAGKGVSRREVLKNAPRTWAVRFSMDYGGSGGDKYNDIPSLGLQVCAEGERTISVSLGLDATTVDPAVRVVARNATTGRFWQSGAQTVHICVPGAQDVLRIQKISATEYLIGGKGAP